MPRKTKDQIADEEYGYDFEDLSPGEKARVTRLFNAQTASSGRRTSTAIRAEVGRVGVNGTKPCLVPAGTTLEEFLKQAGYELDEDKESVISHSTGLKVDMSDVVVNGETYVITPEIKSA